MSKVQEPRGDDNIVDTDNDPDYGPIHDTKEVKIYKQKKYYYCDF